MLSLNELSVKELDGVGDKNYRLLEMKDIRTVCDMLKSFPTRYQQYLLTPLTDECHNRNVTVEGVIISSPITIRRQKLYTTFSMDINNQNIKVIIFNRAFLNNLLLINKKIFVSGKYDKQKGMITATNIFFDFQQSKIEPIYSEYGIPNYQIVKMTKSIFAKYGFLIKETMPKELRDKYQLLGYYEALRAIHQPQSLKEVELAKRRLKYQEILEFELKLKYHQNMVKRQKKEPKCYDLNKVKSFIETIPFQLTHDQKMVVNEIFRDLKQPFVANRLIQGDVGSGKTIVSIIVSYAVITSGQQVALMAPTELLAIQHYETFRRYLPKDTNIILLTGMVKGTTRQKNIEEIAKGEARVIIGTHALIQEAVLYDKLGLVIIDEQQRFGVEQRLALRKKGQNPDCIFLTATPIPRTLAISVFGDLDISSIKTMPSGRLDIITKYINKKDFYKIIPFINEHLALNEQVYFVAPLIEESENVLLLNATDLHERTKKAFSNYAVGLVHGKMKAEEKENALKAFKENQTQILVSTTVVEVGVDISSTTIMVIFDADHFGLSQLHQLRGRVGRNTKQSYCFLVAEQDKKRLMIMEHLSDGFSLSEADLKFRGPGDFFGTKQSGTPSLRFVNFMDDYKMISTACADASQLIDCYEDNKLSDELKGYLENVLINNNGILD